LPQETIRVVFDCNLFVQAFLNPDGVAGRCLQIVRIGRVQLFVSPPALTEVKEVLLRPRILSRLPHASSEQSEAFLDDIVANATTQRAVPDKFHFARDPTDAPYLNLAIAARADYLVTRDRDLLDLMTAHTSESKEFRQRFRHVKIVDPAAFLRELEVPI
jgi:putative PIN family toxin of toxin-antitoxin system